MDRSQTQKAVKIMDLKSERLHLRLSQNQDKAVMISHESNPNIMRYILTVGSPEEVVKGVEHMLQPWNGDENVWISFSVVVKREVIGFVFLNVISYQRAVIEIGYRLHPDHQGKGYAFEAVALFCHWIEAVLKPKRFEAYCVCDNIPSWRLLEKLGFSREQEIPANAEINGQQHAEYLYAKTCSDEEIA